jgi:isocitrate lyase
VGFVVDKMALEQDFPPEYFGFSLSPSFHWCSITWGNEKTVHLSLHLHHKGYTISLKAAVRP